MSSGILVLLAVYAALVALIFAFQRRLMYHPLREIGEPGAHGLPQVREIFLTTSDNVRLQAWTHAPRPGWPTILYFHGNAAHIGDRAAKFAGFVAAGFGLVAMGYRGFGKSGGRPSEQGLYRDARATVAYALGELKLPQGKLIYYGESLGSGVAVQMATEHPPGLVMLEAAYTSVETRSAEIYSYVLGARHFVLDKYDSLSKIKNIHAPLVMIHGENDDIIPPAHGRALFAAANEPKQLIFYPGVNHADFSNEQILAPLLIATAKFGLLKN